MKRIKLTSLSYFFKILSASGFIGVIFNDTISLAASFQSISVPIVVNNQRIGQIQAEVDNFILDPIRQGIVGRFQPDSLVSYPDFLSNTLSNAVSINWLQMGSIIPNNIGVPNPFVDPIVGGLNERWSDSNPWYWDTAVPTNVAEGVPDQFNPNIIQLPNGRIFDNRYSLAQRLSINNNPFTLDFLDFPGSLQVGTAFQFRTFLIAEFANKEYDTLGGFTWNAIVDQQRRTQITALRAGALFLPEFANLVSAFGGSGYKKVLRLPTYKVSSTLSPGKVEGINIIGLPPSGDRYSVNYNPINFLTWTNNSFSGNSPGKPNTLLGAFNSQGQPNYLGSPYNDDGGPYKSNGGSGLSSIVNPDGSIHLKVTGSGDDDFNGQVYKESVCVEYYGGSGGGGCKKYQDVYQPHPESGQYEVLVKLNEMYFPDYYSRVPTPYRSASSFSLAANDGSLGGNLLGSNNQKVPEPASILGLLALAGGATLTKLANRKNR